MGPRRPGDLADHHRVKQLFLAARDVAVEERDAWLAEACGEDVGLRREVESLLAAEEGMPSGYLAPGSGSRLVPGSTVSHYRIVERLGAGGMGEVWLAHDETLDRRVALKFPSAALFGDPSIRQRLQREARAAAALEHPAVCRVFELGQSDRQDFIAMEYLEGETLAARLSRGRVPLEQALAWGAAIAGAVEKAHDRGLVHRDLKPANVMVSPDGQVKVMDFGLARLLPAKGEEAGAAGTSDLTVTGMIVGTPAYMAPELLRGQPADERCDIWAFGCLLFKLLTASRAFVGATATEAVTAILEHEPDWQRLPAETPTEIRHLLARCLRKEPERRLRHVGDARLALDDAVRGEPPPGPLPVTPHEFARAPRRRRLWLASTLLLALSAVLLAWAWLRPSSVPQAEPVRLTITLPLGASVTRGAGVASSVALSPDGRTLVVAATDAQGRRLYRRTLERLTATPIAGTEGGSSPFFSPDGTWVGFFADRRLKRIPAAGGAAVDIAAVPGYPNGATWGPDDRIVFAYGARSPLHVVDMRGGDAEPLTSLDAAAGEFGHGFPEFLPDGHALLFESGSWVHALDLVSGRRTALVQGVAPRYAASGHVIVSRGTTLLAAPFDAKRLELTGPLVPLVEGVAVEATTGARHVAVSRNGTLAYAPTAGSYTLALVRADGSEHPLLEEEPLIENPQFSPDGRRLAVATARQTSERPDLWIYDVDAEAPPARLTFDSGRAPVWTPDGAAVTYSHPVPGQGWGIYTRYVDGRGDAEQVVPLSEFHWLVGWTPDGRTLVYGMMEAPAADGVTRSSIMAYADGESRRVVGPGQTWGGRLSPDGRWLAYYSLESGYFEVYVTAFPNADTRWYIAEGTDPAWSPDGSEVYYRSGSRLMAARIDRARGIRVMSRRVVIEPFSPPLFDDYDIHPDGRTLTLVRPAAASQAGEITMVLDWLTELRRLMPR